MVIAVTAIPLADTAGRLNVGVCAHLSLYAKDSFKPQILGLLDATAQLGARHVRWDAHWAAVETEKGKLDIPPMWDFSVDEGNRRGLESVLILDYGNKLYNDGRRPLTDDDIASFLRYAKTVVSHFRGKVGYFEIWNEWDMGNGGAGEGSAEEYLRLVSAVYPALKAIAPKAIFLVGGSSRIALDSLAQPELLGPEKRGSHFLEKALELGLLRYGDGLSVHPYTRWGLSTQIKLSQYRDLMHAVQEKVRAANHGKPFPLYVTEFGWPTSQFPPIASVSGEDQATLITQAIKITAAELPDVKMMTIYQLTDMARNKPLSAAYNYGLLEGFAGNDPKKPAYHAVQSLLKTMSP